MSRALAGDKICDVLKSYWAINRHRDFRSLFQEKKMAEGYVKSDPLTTRVLLYIY